MLITSFTDGDTMDNILPSDGIIFQIILIYETWNCQIFHQKGADSGLSRV